MSIRQYSESAVNNKYNESTFFYNSLYTVNNFLKYKFDSNKKIYNERFYMKEKNYMSLYEALCFSHLRKKTKCVPKKKTNNISHNNYDRPNPAQA